MFFFLNSFYLCGSVIFFYFFDNYVEDSGKSGEMKIKEC